MQWMDATHGNRTSTPPTIVFVAAGPSRPRVQRPLNPSPNPFLLSQLYPIMYGLRYLERFRPGCLQLRWMSVFSHPLRKERTKDGAPEVVLTLNSKML